MERVIPDEASVYRCIDRRHGRTGLSHRAFLLREPKPGRNEEYLSVSESRENALQSLKDHAGAAELQAGAVRSLQDLDGVPLALEVQPLPNPNDPGYAGIFGVPPWAPEGTLERIQANEAADALCRIARYPA